MSCRCGCLYGMAGEWFGDLAFVFLYLFLQLGCFVIFFNALDATVCFKMARCCCARLYCDYQMSLDGSVDF